MARVALWPRQGEQYRGAKKGEGLALGAGRLAEHGDGDLGARGLFAGYIMRR